MELKECRRGDFGIIAGLRAQIIKARGKLLGANFRSKR